MLKKLKTIGVSTVLFLSLTILVTTVTSLATSEMYSVKPVLTENQIDGVENYVSIKSEGDLNQTFKYKITNRSDEDLVIKVEPLNALTSSNGVIQYLVKTEEENSIITDRTYLFTNYVEVSPSVVVPAKESKVVDVAIKMPNVNGQVLGGIGFSSISEGESTIEGDSQFTINNELKTVIGFLVDFGGETETEFIFGEPFINPMPSYYALRLPMEFKSSVIVENLTIKYEVKDSANNTVFESVEEKPLNFAPMTKTNYVIPWDNSKISKGKEYTIDGEVSYIVGGTRETVNFSEVFSLTGKETADGNSLISNTYEGIDIVGNGGIKEFFIDNKFISIMIVVTLFLLLIMILLMRRTKNEDIYEMIMFSDSPQCPEFITKEDEENLNKLEVMHEASNKDNKKFGIVYVLINDNDSNETIFKLDRIMSI